MDYKIKGDFILTVFKVDIMKGRVFALNVFKIYLLSFDILFIILYLKTF